MATNQINFTEDFSIYIIDMLHFYYISNGDKIEREQVKIGEGRG
jgi:hypothetical protein